MRVYELEVFRKSLQKTLSDRQVRQFDKRVTCLKQSHGKPLGPYWLRELRFGGKRVYYVVRDDCALFVSASDKKSQQKVIDTLRADIEVFRDLLDQLTRWTRPFFASCIACWACLTYSPSFSSAFRRSYSFLGMVTVSIGSCRWLLFIVVSAGLVGVFATCLVACSVCCAMRFRSSFWVRYLVIYTWH